MGEYTIGGPFPPLDAMHPTANQIGNYLPILIQFVLAGLLAGGLIVVSRLVGQHRSNKIKLAPYECGMTPKGDVRSGFAVKFYLVAIVFILFDVEAVFLLPWAVEFRQLRWLGFVEMVIYIGIVLAGFVYIWKKGVLDWNASDHRQPGLPPPRGDR
ncbi:MAG: NADH-quinone oxidoreductase subunit A [Terriglobales bacterium]